MLSNLLKPVTLTPLIHTFNSNTLQPFAKYEMRLCFKDLLWRAHLKICGILARQALENRFVLVKRIQHFFSRRLITGGMDTKVKKLCSSTSGNSRQENFWDTTSKSGLIDTLSSQKSRDPLCHLNAQNELSLHPTTQFKNASEPTQPCWLQSSVVLGRSISTLFPTSTSNSAIDDWTWSDSE
jgi:hypothetical protein